MLRVCVCVCVCVSHGDGLLTECLNLTVSGGYEWGLKGVF